MRRREDSDPFGDDATAEEAAVDRRETSPLPPPSSTAAPAQQRALRGGVPTLQLQRMLGRPRLDGPTTQHRDVDDWLDPTWAEAADAMDYCVSCVSCPLVVSGPQARVAFDALRHTFEHRQRSKLATAGAAAARAVVESVVAPLASSSGLVAAAAQAPTAAERSSPPTKHRSRLPSPAYCSPSESKSDLHDLAAAASATAATGGSTAQPLLAGAVDVATIRTAQLPFRDLSNSRFVRAAVETAIVRQRRKAQGRGAPPPSRAAVDRSLESLSDTCLSAHHRSIRMLQATASRSAVGATMCQAYVQRATSVGRIHVVSASYDAYLLRRRRCSTRTSFDEARDSKTVASVHSRPATALRTSVESPQTTLTPDPAFDEWFATDVQESLQAAAVATSTVSATSTVLLLTTDRDGWSAEDSPPPRDLQEFLLRIRAACSVVDAEAYPTGQSPVGPPEEANGSLHGDGRDDRPLASSLAAVVLVHLDFGSCSLVGAAHGEIAVSRVSVQPGSSIIRGYSAFCSCPVVQHAPELSEMEDLASLLEALAVHQCTRVAAHAECVASEPLVRADAAIREQLLEPSTSPGGAVVVSHEARKAHDEADLVGAAAWKTDLPRIRDRLSEAGVDERDHPRAVGLLHLWGTVQIVRPLAALSAVHLVESDAVCAYRPSLAHRMTEAYAAVLAHHHKTTTGNSNSSEPVPLNDLELVERHFVPSVSASEHRRFLLGDCLAVSVTRPPASANDGAFATARQFERALGSSPSMVGRSGLIPTIPPNEVYAMTPLIAAFADLARLTPSNSGDGHRSCLPVNTTGRWIALRCDARLVLPSLLLVFASSAIRILLCWSNGFVLGVDGEDAENDEGGGTVLPQRTLCVSPVDPSTGLLVPALFVSTITAGCPSGELHAATSERAASAMGDMVVDVLRQLRDTALLPGVVFDASPPSQQPSLSSVQVPSSRFAELGMSSTLAGAQEALLACVSGHPSSRTNEEATDDHVRLRCAAQDALKVVDSTLLAIDSHTRHVGPLRRAPVSSGISCASQGGPPPAAEQREEDGDDWDVL